LVSTEWSTDSWLRVDLRGHVAVVVNALRGTPSVFTTSGDSIVATTTTAPILQPEQEVRIFRPAESPVWVLSAHINDLDRLFREITGSDRGRLDFESDLNRESPEGRRFQRLIDFAVEELRVNPSAIENPIIRRQLNDAVFGGILSLPGKHLHPEFWDGGWKKADVSGKSAWPFLHGDKQVSLSLACITGEERCG